MFLTPGQTGGLLVFSLRQHDRCPALEGGPGGEIRDFDIGQLAEALFQRITARLSRATSEEIERDIEAAFREVRGRSTPR